MLTSFSPHVPETKLLITPGAVAAGITAGSAAIVGKREEKKKYVWRNYQQAIEHNSRTGGNASLCPKLE